MTSWHQLKPRREKKLETECSEQFRSPRGFSLVSPCDYFCMWRPRYLILWPRLTVTSDSVTSYIWLKIWNSVRGSSPLTRWGTVKHTANKLWHPTGKFQNHINHHKVNASKQIWIKEYDHDEPLSSSAPHEEDRPGSNIPQGTSLHL